MLPTELLDKITIMSEDSRVAEVLKRHITYHASATVVKNVLVYGEVQSGKTRAVLNILQNPQTAHLKKILVVQNSLCVLNQYKQRLEAQGLDFQIVDSSTETIHSDILVIINNVHRYRILHKCMPKTMRYVLVLDEADATINSCPLKNAVQNFYVTATPFNISKRVEINQVLKINRPKNYFGLDKVDFKFEAPNKSKLLERVSTTQMVDVWESSIISDDFLKQPSGIMLINSYNLIDSMNSFASRLSKQFTEIPIVVLNTQKHMYLRNQKSYIYQNSIQKIIDRFSAHPHIIFVADRCAFRGLSYTSSDYTRHLTHQITAVKSSVTSFLQSMRIFGVYNDIPKLRVYLRPCDKDDFEKYMRFMKAFQVEQLFSEE